MTRWSKKELKFLKGKYKDFNYIEISEKLKRPIGSIYWKAFELKLKKGRWNKDNKLNKQKVIKLLIKEKNRSGKSPSAREMPISLKSACQRHFGGINNAKKSANLQIKKPINILPKNAYKPSEELAYIIGLLLGDGSFRYQKSKKRKTYVAYVIIFSSKDKDLMGHFTNKFKIWSGFEPKVSIIKAGYKRFPSGKLSYYKKTYNTQIAFKEAWIFLKKFKNNPSICLNFFPKEHYRWIIKGLWDAEGCIRKNSKTIRIHFSNSNKEILSLYKGLLKEYNLNYTIDKLRKTSPKVCFNITTSDNFCMLKFIKLIDGITIKRKETPKIKEIVRRLEKQYANINIYSNFNQEAYNIVKKIPCGFVSTYGQIAMLLNNANAHRAVGQAMKNNPNPIKTPCHRVINSDGSLGGYSGKLKGKEIRKKINLLKKEGIKIENNKINLKKFGFFFNK